MCADRVRRVDRVVVSATESWRGREGREEDWIWQSGLDIDTCP